MIHYTIADYMAAAEARGAAYDATIQIIRRRKDSNSCGDHEGLFDVRVFTVELGLHFKDGKLALGHEVDVVYIDGDHYVLPTREAFVANVRPKPHYNDPRVVWVPHDARLDALKKHTPPDPDALLQDLVCAIEEHRSSTPNVKTSIDYLCESPEFRRALDRVQRRLHPTN